MKQIGKKLWIYPVSLCLIGLFFGLHYLMVYDAAFNSKDARILGMYQTLGWVLLAVGLFCIALISHFVHPVESVQSGILQKAGRFFTLTIEKTYFFTVLLFGLVYVFVLPPLSAPDEVSHYISAYQLSNTLLGTRSKVEDGHVLIRSEDLAIEDVKKDYRLQESEVGGKVVFVKTNTESPSVVISQTLENDDYMYIYENLSYLDDGKDDLGVSSFPPVRTTAIAYLAPAIGISLARVLGLGSMYLLFFGRIANLLLYVILMTLALKKLPLFKEIYFGVSLLPMSLHLAASYSYDAFIFAMYALVIAHILYLRFRADRVTVFDLVVITLLFAIVAPCKMIYAPLALLAFLVPKQKFGSNKFYLISILVVAMSIIASIMLTNFLLITEHVVGSTNLAWAGEESVSLGFMLHNPVRILRMIYNTLIYQLDFYHFSMIGQYLGNLDEILNISYFAVIVFTLCLIALGMAKQDEEIRLVAVEKWLIVAVLVLTVGLTELSMLLAWTPISSTMIQGVQGRYFLPALPLMLMLLKQKGFVFTMQKNRMALIVMCWMNAFVLMRMFAMISMRL